MLTALALAQAVAGPFLPAAPRPRSAAPCPIAADTTDVVVCARDPGTYRLKPLPGDPPPRDGLPRAEVKLGHTKLSAEAEAAGLPGGIPINRAMLRWKVPLGRRAK